MDGLVSWQQTEPAKQTTCPQCGTSHREIVLRETAGCELCFEVFSASIERILGNRRVRGFHSGRIPKRLQRYRRMFVEREDLIARLNVALDSEDFERAAELRDRIQSMSADESASE
jgi:protein arginine kinase activator